MTKNSFVDIMREFEKQHNEAEEWYNKLEDVLSCGAIENVLSYNYFPLVITIIKRAMEDHYGWIELVISSFMQ